MAKYSIYNDFTICDGTHNCSKYTLKLMPFTNVDYLGRNFISGLALSIRKLNCTLYFGYKNYYF
jgi:hypothetical protein